MKAEELAEYVKKLIKNRFIGRLVLHFSGDGINKIEKTEVIKKNK